MTEQKTIATGQSVIDFLNQIPDEQKRRDSLALLEMMKEATGEEPVLWVGNMIGFGRYHYRYPTGHEGDAFRAGFAPRKDNITLYTYAWFEGRDELLDRLGKHKRGKACTYIKRLDDIDLAVLREFLTTSYAELEKLYPKGQ